MIPHDDAYVNELGLAVYIFSYYEWAVIYLIDRIRPGYVSRYTDATRPMTTGKVVQDFEQAIAEYRRRDCAVVTVVSKLESYLQDLKRLKDLRNHLIHAHPITDDDGYSQVLLYHNRAKSVYKKWQVHQINCFAKEVSRAAVLVVDLYHNQSSLTK